MPTSKSSDFLSPIQANLASTPSSSAVSVLCKKCNGAGVIRRRGVPGAFQSRPCPCQWANGKITSDGDQ